MGIRFYCPDCGRRLNIKAFLAGKRGICPHCDSRVQIPMESQLPTEAPKYRPTSEGTAESPVAAATIATVDSDSNDAVESQRTVAASIDATPSDPIADAPDCVWYVRPSGGGQYGPARGDVMRRWLSEGRVSADSMVWQEGWADWKLAGPVFPSLESVPATATATPVIETTVKSAPSFLVPEDEEQDISKPVAAPERRVAARKKSIAPLIILGLLIVVLLVVTVIILQRA